MAPLLLSPAPVFRSQLHIHKENIYFLPLLSRERYEMLERTLQNEGFIQVLAIIITFTAALG